MGTKKSWDRIITIEINGKRRVARIANTRDAAYCLLEDWPVKNGFSYHRAILGCTKALKGEASDEEAQFCLTDAAEDARLPFVVSLGAANLDTFDSEIAAICDELVLQDLMMSAPAADRVRRQRLA